MELFDDTEVLNAQPNIKESLKSSMRKFLFITFIFILPLSLFQWLFESSFGDLVTAVFNLFDKASAESHEQFVRPYYIRNFVYLVFFCTFYFLSTSAMVFTIASHYVSRPVSYISIIHAIPSILKRLLITSIYALPLVIGAYLANFAYLFLIHAIPKMNVIPIIFTIVDAHIIVFWNLANVISVLEPNFHGLSAMKRSRQLLPGIGNTFMAIFLVCLYLFAADVILIMGNLIMHMNIHITVRILLVAFWVIIMGGGLNFVGLIGQSALYYRCKSYHKQVIDKKVLSEHLHGKESGNNNSTEGDNIKV